MNNNFIKTNRKKQFIKATNLDLESIKKKREESYLKLRKEKRLEILNIERRKMATTTDSDMKDNNSNQQFDNNFMNIIRQHTYLLYSNDSSKLEVAIVFFKTILSRFKTPPIHLLVENNVIPRIVFLLENSQHTLSNEFRTYAAWCITNIACGDESHVIILLESNIIAIFSTILTSETFNDSPLLKIQIIWALSNLSQFERSIAILLRDHLLLTYLFRDLGIYTPESFYDGSSDVYLLKNRMNIIQKAPDIDSNPSLSAMRNINNIIANILRFLPNPNLHIYCLAIYAFSILIYSPDEEVVKDCCRSIVFLSHLPECNYRNFCLDLIFELGLIRRLKDLSQTSKSLFELSTVALASIYNTSQSLFRAIVLFPFVSLISQKHRSFDFSRTLINACQLECSLDDKKELYLAIQSYLVENDQSVPIFIQDHFIQRLCDDIRIENISMINFLAGTILCILSINESFPIEIFTVKKILNIFQLLLMSQDEYLRIKVFISCIHLYQTCRDAHIYLNEFIEIKNSAEMMLDQPSIELFNVAQYYLELLQFESK